MYVNNHFKHMLFMVHPEYRPQKPTKSFTGKLYGFKIHPSAYDMQGPGTKAVRMAQGHTISRNNAARAMNWVVDKSVKKATKKSDDEKKTTKMNTSFKLVISLIPV